MKNFHNELIDKRKELKLEKIDIKERLKKSKTLSELFDTKVINHSSENYNLDDKIPNPEFLKYKTKVDKIQTKLQNEVLNHEDTVIQNLLQEMIIKEMMSSIPFKTKKTRKPRSMKCDPSKKLSGKIDISCKKSHKQLNKNKSDTIEMKQRKIEDINIIKNDLHSIDNIENEDYLTYLKLIEDKNRNNKRFDSKIQDKLKKKYPEKDSK